MTERDKTKTPILGEPYLVKIKDGRVFMATYREHILDDPKIKPYWDIILILVDEDGKEVNSWSHIQYRYNVDDIYISLHEIMRPVKETNDKSVWQLLGRLEHEIFDLKQRVIDLEKYVEDSKKPIIPTPVPVDPFPYPVSPYPVNPIYPGFPQPITYCATTSGAPIIPDARFESNNK